MTFFKYFFIYLSMIVFAHAGETRTWSDAGGEKSFEAKFVSREGNKITLLTKNGKKIEINSEILHEKDRNWLNLHHPAASAEEAPDNAVFDTLIFGDSRSLVSEKLENSKFVLSSVAGTFQGRTGLNGIYHTKHKIGGLFCYLFFDWDDAGKLNEVTLQTEIQTESAYERVLKPCWEECIPLISSIHGKALQSSEFIKSTALEDGQMLASHIWRIESGGTVMLGVAKEGLGYQVAVRFTKEVIGANPRP